MSSISNAYLSSFQCLKFLQPQRAAVKPSPWIIVINIMTTELAEVHYGSRREINTYNGT